MSGTDNVNEADSYINLNYMKTFTKCVFCGYDFTTRQYDLISSKFLECFHPVCAVCVLHWDSQDKKMCPKCLLVLNKTVTDTKILQECISINDMDDVIEMCGMHQEIEGTHWCEDCAEYVCEECIKHHKQLKVTKHHVIKTKAEYLKSCSNNSRCNFPCKVHPEEQLLIYCVTCDEMTCRDCQLTCHRDHQYSFITDVIDHFKKEIFEKNCDIRFYLLVLEKSLEVLLERKVDVAKEKQRNQKKVTDTYNGIINELLKRKEELLKKVDDIGQLQLEKIKEKEKQITQAVNMVKHFTNLTTNILHGSSDMSIIHYRKNILNCLELVNKKLSADSPLILPNPIRSIDIRFLSASSDIMSIVEKTNSMGSIITRNSTKKHVLRMLDSTYLNDLNLESKTSSQETGNKGQTSKADAKINPMKSTEIVVLPSPLNGNQPIESIDLTNDSPAFVYQPQPEHSKSGFAEPPKVGGDIAKTPAAPPLISIKNLVNISTPSQLVTHPNAMLAPNSSSWHTPVNGGEASAQPNTGRTDSIISYTVKNNTKGRPSWHIPVVEGGPVQEISNANNTPSASCPKTCNEARTSNVRQDCSNELTYYSSKCVICLKTFCTLKCQHCSKTYHKSCYSFVTDNIKSSSVLTCALCVTRKTIKEYSKIMTCLEREICAKVLFEILDNKCCSKFFIGNSANDPNDVLNGLKKNFNCEWSVNEFVKELKTVFVVRAESALNINTAEYSPLTIFNVSSMILHKYLPNSIKTYQTYLV